MLSGENIKQSPDSGSQQASPPVGRCVLHETTGYGVVPTDVLQQGPARHCGDIEKEIKWGTCLE